MQLQNYEWSEMYKEFAEIAEEEGYTEVAFTFRKIAEVEYEHEKRYQKLLDNIQNGQVFKRDEVVRWQCRNCGYVHEGKEAPEVCPSCKHPRAHFEIMKSNY
jgi:rubrerythrin